MVVQLGRIDTVFAARDADVARQYNEDGYVLLKGGILPDALRRLQDLYTEFRDTEQNRLSAWAIKNKKQQYLLAFDGDDEFLNVAKDLIAEVTGLPREKLTVSERHIKAYTETADPNPLPHKDRFASQINIGIPLHIKKDSVLTLYPDLGLATNFANRAIVYDPSDAPVPEPVLVQADPGDVLLFRGADVFHERRNAAGSVILYIKMNAMRLDPLGEDPSSVRNRRFTQDMVAAQGSAPTTAARAERSPRILAIRRSFESGFRHEGLSIDIHGEAEGQAIDTEDLEMLQRLEEPTDVEQLVGQGEGNGAEQGERRARLLKLCSIGAIDLVPSEDASAT